MKAFKKVIAVVLALMMVLALVACGSSSSGDTADTAPAATGSSDAAPASDGTTKTAVGEYSESNPYKLTFTYVEFYEQDAAERQAVVDALNEYMIPNYNIEVEFYPLSYTEFMTNFGTSIMAYDEYDVIPVFYSTVSSWINAEAMVDLAPYMDTADGQKIVAALGQETATVSSINGFQYGLPAMKESVELGGLWMRADICDELGLTEKYDLDKSDGTYTGTIYNWSVAGDIFAQVKAAHPEMTPLYMYNSDQSPRFYFVDPLVDRFGVLDWQADHDSTTVVNEFETESFRNMCHLLADWYDKGYIFGDAATDTQGTATMIKAGNTFSYATAIKPGFLAEANASNNTDGYAMYFGDQVEGGMASHSCAFFGFGIADSSKDPEMAFKFLSALYTDPVVMNYWQYGIEGVDYQVLDDGTAYFADGVDNSNFKYYQNTGWAGGNQFISYVWNDGTKDAGYWDALAAHNNWTYYSPAFGFMWDSSDYTTYITALNTALETYRAALSTGSVGSANVDATIDKLNDALYAAGLQEVIDAKQAQLDAWLADNGPTATPQSNLDLIATGEYIPN
ncbi:MAG: ABC transporter substrate-binding protein [Oscillospiraceae bacterium]|nr:ABC transporter substrate-binding protein [Oscillospiraceae bacterium]